MRKTSRQICSSWVRLSPLAGCALLAACTGPGSSAVVGLPPEEFDRAYAAGYDIAAAERCGETIDAGLVRYNLVQDIKRREIWAMLSPTKPDAPLTKLVPNSPANSKPAPTTVSPNTQFRATHLRFTGKESSLPHAKHLCDNRFLNKQIRNKNCNVPL